jgi:hypothetical protein
MSVCLLLQTWRFGYSLHPTQPPYTAASSTWTDYHFAACLPYCQEPSKPLLLQLLGWLQLAAVAVCTPPPRPLRAQVWNSASVMMTCNALTLHRLYICCCCLQSVQLSM